jgi:hypothetical protein
MRRRGKGWTVRPVARKKVCRFGPVLCSSWLIGCFSIVPVTIIASELRRPRVGLASTFYLLQRSSLNIHLISRQFNTHLLHAHTLQSHLPTARVLSPLSNPALSPTHGTGQNSTSPSTTLPSMAQCHFFLRSWPFGSSSLQKSSVTTPFFNKSSSLGIMRRGCFAERWIRWIGRYVHLYPVL